MLNNELIYQTKPLLDLSNALFLEISEYADGRTSIGWFFGLKAHLVINQFGELIAFKITRDNVSDSAVAGSLLTALEGLAFGDKGYIGKKLFDELFKKV